MKRKNDRSAKIVLVTSSAVVLLVGVSVFSLYSLNKNDENKGLTLASVDTDESTNDKFLGKMKSSAEAVVAGVAVTENENVPSATLKDETESTEDTQPIAVLSVTSTAIDSIALPTSEEDVVTGEDSQNETKIETESVATQNVELTTAEGTKVLDAATSMEQTTATESAGAAVSEYVAENMAPQEEIIVVDNVVNTDSSAAYEEEVYVDVADLPASDTEYYDSQEEYYDIQYTEPVEDVVVEDSVVDTSAETTYDDGGEWIFDYDTEEWRYVYSIDSAAEDANNIDDSYDTEDTSYADDTYDDGGEWIFDYDTEEWKYVYNTDGAAEDTNNIDNSYDTEDTSYVDDTYDDGGEWIYDYDTEEWKYVYNTDSTAEDTNSTDDTYIEDEPQEWDDTPDIDDSNGYDDSEDTYDSDEYYDNSLGQQIVNYAMSYVGYTPYVWAGRSLDSGTDCSGFINLIYADFGIYCSAASLAYDGSSFGYIISQDELQPGDIVVYGGGDHVAIYAGNGYVVHCSSPENGTVYWNMYYRSDISWFLRVL